MPASPHATPAASSRLARPERVPERDRGDLVVCYAPGGEEIARGLVNYSAEESRSIIGQPSHRIEEILGYVDEPELIHRDNLVLMG